MTKQVIIIPDVHGRTFWKSVVEQDPDADIIFLGDYLDPYTQEGIYNYDAWLNLVDIVEFKKEHPDM